MGNLYKSIDDRFDQANDMMAVQLESSLGNGSDEYMLGMYNGMAFMLSVFEQNEPSYIDIEQYKEVTKDNE